MEDQRHSPLSEKIAAAASVATAIATVKTAAETAKARQEMEAVNRTIQSAAEKQERIQRAMAFDQIENNFRNTILATLPLLKDEEDKKQFLTEQFLPKLREAIGELVITPLEIISLMDEEHNTIETYIESEAGQELKAFLSNGNDLITRNKELQIWIKQLEAKVKDAESADESLQYTIQHPIRSMGPIKTSFLAIFLGLFTCLITDKDAMKVVTNDLLIPLLSMCLLISILIRFIFYRLKIDRLRAKSVSPLTNDLVSTLKEKSDKLNNEARLHDAKLDAFKTQIVIHLIKDNNILDSDPHALF